MIGIIDYGMGNIQSVRNAFEYMGADVKVIVDPSELSGIDKIVLPGVGAFATGLNNLRKQSLWEALSEEVLHKKKPFLGICLGMQLICNESFEFGHHYGFGWVDATVHRFDPGLAIRVPHVGWNNLIIKRTNRLLDYAQQEVDVYFVHSYYVEAHDQDMVVATCEYGREFCAMIEKDNIFATQFHPEKSQHVGLSMLKRFTELGHGA